MDKPLIICFSLEKQKIGNIRFELTKYFKTSDNQLIFNDKELLLETLKLNNINEVKTGIVVLKLEDSDSETIHFINKVNELSKNPVMLIISENNHLIEILDKVEKNNSLQFLSEPFTNSDLILSLNHTLIKYNNLQNSSDININENHLPDSIEEAVSERFKELIESNKAKDSFFSIISHDLKSPFTALLGISEILTDDWDDLTEENKLELIADIKKTSESTFKLLEELLEWSKVQKEKLEVRSKEIEIRELVNSSIKLTKHNASPKRLEVKNEINEDLVVSADENMIGTVFRNLITNAVKFTPPGGKIKISAKEEADYCTFCVEDNGEGIDKQHILELFKKGNNHGINGNAHAFKGLGLLICKDFVEINGGKIWLETEKGMGSKFFFTIPVLSS